MNKRLFEEILASTDGKKYFRFSASDFDEDYIWGYAEDDGDYVTSDSTDITLDKIKKVDVKTATAALMDFLKECGIKADYNYVNKSIGRAFANGKYTMKMSTWWDGYYEEFDECILEVTDNPLTDWEEFEDGLDRDYSKNNKSTEDKYDRIYRLFKRAGYWVSGFATADHDGPNGEAVWIGDGGWKTVNYTRSDEDIINDIKKLEDD